MKLYKIFSDLKDGVLIHNNSTQHTQGTNNTLKLESLEIAFILVRDRISAQLDRDDKLEAKTNFALVTATGIVSAALLLQSLLLPSHSHSLCAALLPGFLQVLRALPLVIKRIVPILPLLLTYLYAVLLACRIFGIGGYLEVPEPGALIDNYLDKPENQTKRVVLDTMRQAYEENSKIMDKKEDLISQLLVVLLIEAIWFVLLLIYQMAC